MFTKPIKPAEPVSTAASGVVDYQTTQRAFAKAQVEGLLSTAATKVTQANKILYEAGMIKGELLK